MAKRCKPVIPRAGGLPPFLRGLGVQSQVVAIVPSARKDHLGRARRDPKAEYVAAKGGGSLGVGDVEVDVTPLRRRTDGNIRFRFLRISSRFDLYVNLTDL